MAEVDHVAIACRKRHKASNDFQFIQNFWKTFLSVVGFCSG
jgi:hypothetical protein